MVVVAAETVVNHVLSESSHLLLYCCSGLSVSGLVWFVLKNSEKKAFGW